MIINRRGAKSKKTALFLSILIVLSIAPIYLIELKYHISFRIALYISNDNPKRNEYLYKSISSYNELMDYLDHLKSLKSNSIKKLIESSQYQKYVVDEIVDWNAYASGLNEKILEYGGRIIYIFKRFYAIENEDKKIIALGLIYKA